MKLWLWKNFVDGRPEYWAFDNPYPINMHDGDPQTLGEPCGYAIVKPSRNGRPDVPEEQVIEAIKRAKRAEPPPRFPTMLRKMWSGSEVQEWINENWNKS